MPLTSPFTDDDMDTIFELIDIVEEQGVLTDTQQASLEAVRDRYPHAPAVQTITVRLSAGWYLTRSDWCRGEATEPVTIGEAEALGGDPIPPESLGGGPIPPVEDRRAELLDAIATVGAELAPDEPVIASERVCERLPHRPDRYGVTDEDGTGWAPSLLAEALRRAGVFSQGFLWAEPYDGSVIDHHAAYGVIDTFPAAGEHNHGRITTTTWATQIDINRYRGDQVHLTIVGSSCGASAEEVVNVVLTQDELGRLLDTLELHRADNQAEAA